MFQPTLTATDFGGIAMLNFRNYQDFEHEEILCLILEDVTQTGSSAGWFGPTETVNLLAADLLPLGIHYTDDMQGVWSKPLRSCGARNQLITLTSSMRERHPPISDEP